MELNACNIATSPSIIFFFCVYTESMYNWVSKILCQLNLGLFLKEEKFEMK